MCRRLLEGQPSGCIFGSFYVFFCCLQKLLGLRMAMAEQVCLAISHLECSCLSTLGPEGNFFIFSYVSCVLPG